MRTRNKIYPKSWWVQISLWVDSLEYGSAQRCNIRVCAWQRFGWTINGIMGNQNGKPKKSWDCAIRYNNPIGEIARDALLAESASGGLNRMQLFQFQALWWVKMFFQRNNEDYDCVFSFIKSSCFIAVPNHKQNFNLIAVERVEHTHWLA